MYACTYQMASRKFQEHCTGNYLVEGDLVVNGAIDLSDVILDGLGASSVVVTDVTSTLDTIAYATTAVPDTFALRDISGGISATSGNFSGLMSVAVGASNNIGLLTSSSTSGIFDIFSPVLTSIRFGFGAVPLRNLLTSYSDTTSTGKIGLDQSASSIEFTNGLVKTTGDAQVTGNLRAASIGAVTPGSGTFTTLNTTSTLTVAAGATANIALLTSTNVNSVFDIFSPVQTNTRMGFGAVPLRNLLTSYNDPTSTGAIGIDSSASKIEFTNGLVKTIGAAEVTGNLTAASIGAVTPGSGVFTVLKAGSVYMNAAVSVQGVYTNWNDPATGSGLSGQAVFNNHRGGGTGGFDFVSYSNLGVKEFVPLTISVDGQAVLNSALQVPQIGNVTRGSGKFTTLGASGLLTVDVGAAQNMAVFTSSNASAIIDVFAPSLTSMRFGFGAIPFRNLLTSFNDATSTGKIGIDTSTSAIEFTNGLIKTTGNAQVTGNFTPANIVGSSTGATKGSGIVGEPNGALEGIVGANSYITTSTTVLQGASNWTTMCSLNLNFGTYLVSYVVYASSIATNIHSILRTSGATFVLGTEISGFINAISGGSVCNSMTSVLVITSGNTLVELQAMQEGSSAISGSNNKLCAIRIA
jgi:hypothetical protein